MAQPTFVSMTALFPAPASAAASAQVLTMPASIAANDLLVALMYHRSNSTAAALYFDFPSGWTNNVSFHVKASGVPRSGMEVWYRVAASAGEPSITVSANADVINGWSGTIAAYRGVDTGTPFDATSVTNFATASAATYQPPGIVTVTASALAVSYVGHTDDAAVSARAADLNAFTLRASGTGYETTLGSDHGIAFADKVIPAAASASTPIWSKGAAGAQRWLGVTFAIKPGSAAAAPPMVSRFAAFPLLGVM